MQIKIKKRPSGVVASLTGIVALLGTSEVVFDQHNKTIRPAMISDRRVSKISENGTISIASVLRPDEFIGTWECEEVKPGVFQMFKA